MNELYIKLYEYYEDNFHKAKPIKGVPPRKLNFQEFFTAMQRFEQTGITLDTFLDKDGKVIYTKITNSFIFRV